MTNLIVNGEIIQIIWTSNEYEAKHNPHFKKLEIMHTYDKDGYNHERIFNVWTPSVEKFAHLIKHWNRGAMKGIHGYNHHYVILEN